MLITPHRPTICPPPGLLNPDEALKAMPLLYTSFFSRDGGGGAPVGNDPYWDNVVLLSGFEGTDGSTSFVDESQSGHTLTAVGDAQIDTAQKKFGDSSLLLDGNGDYAQAADSDDFSFDADPFTMEAWVRPATTGGFSIITKYNTTVGTAEWFFAFSGTELTFLYFDTGNNVRSTTGSTSFTALTWAHVAADRVGNDIRVYKDGSVIGTLNTSTAMHNRTNPLKIGSRTHGTPLHMNGHMDEVRITKGVGRYGGPFTPPTEAFPRQ